MDPLRPDRIHAPIAAFLVGKSALRFRDAERFLSSSLFGRCPSMR
jgi:hypothetical protein